MFFKDYLYTQINDKMKPNFPITNVILNGIYDLTKREFLWDSYEKIIGVESFDGTDYVQLEIERIKDLSQTFEREIHQTIQGNNEYIITAHFELIKQYRDDIADFSMNDVKRLVSQYNLEFEQEHQAANEKNKKSTGTFSDKILQRELNTEANKSGAKFIDYDKITPYYEWYSDVRSTFLNIVDPLIKKFEKGEYTKQDSDKTYYDKLIKKLLNNKIVAIIIISVIAISAVFGIFQFGVLLKTTFTDKKDTLNVKLAQPLIDASSTKLQNNDTLTKNSALNQSEKQLVTPKKDSVHNIPSKTNM